jgi:hypothetical protein
LYPEVFQGGEVNDATNIRNNFGKKWGWYHHIRVLCAAFNYTIEQVEQMRIHEAFMEMAYQSDLNTMAKQKA